MKYKLRLALVCLLVMAACVVLLPPDPEPRAWADRICEGHGGLRKTKLGPLGEKTAICKDGCRHTWTPSIKEKMERMKDE